MILFKLYERIAEVCAATLCLFIFVCFWVVFGFVAFFEVLGLMFTKVDIIFLSAAQFLSIQENNTFLVLFGSYFSYLEFGILALEYVCGVRGDVPHTHFPGVVACLFTVGTFSWVVCFAGFGDCGVCFYFLHQRS